VLAGADSPLEELSDVGFIGDESFSLELVINDYFFRLIFLQILG
jgi:hypothetical protein